MWPQLFLPQISRMSFRESQNKHILSGRRKLFPPMQQRLPMSGQTHDLAQTDISPHRVLKKELLLPLKPDLSRGPPSNPLLLSIIYFTLLCTGIQTCYEDHIRSTLGLEAMSLSHSHYPPQVTQQPRHMAIAVNFTYKIPITGHGLQVVANPICQHQKHSAHLKWNNRYFLLEPF